MEHYDMGDNYNLELSEEFISLILQQVDDLCENIKHGDPDIQRTLEVNKSLNDAVSCYRSKQKPKNKGQTLEMKSMHIYNARGWLGLAKGFAGWTVPRLGWYG